MPLKRKTFPDIQITSIGDLELQLLPDGSYSFKKPTQTTPDRMRQEQRQRLARLLYIVILSSGLPRHDPAAWKQTRVYSANAHPVFDKYEWHIANENEIVGTPLTTKWSSTTTASGLARATYNSWGAPLSFDISADTSQASRDLDASENDYGVVILAGHPLIQHGPTVLRAQQRYRTALPRNALQRDLPTTTQTNRRKREGVQLLLHRLQRQLQTDPDVHHAVQQTMNLILTRRPPGISNHQYHYWHRLIIVALNTRDNQGQPTRCPHQSCSALDEHLTTAHIVWHCPHARTIWSKRWEDWTGVPVELFTGDALESCIGPVTPRLARIHLQRLHARGYSEETITAAAHTVWTICWFTSGHLLWLRRNELAFSDADQRPPTITERQLWTATANNATSFATYARSSGDDAAVGNCMAALLDSLTEAPRPEPPLERQVRLYYDGGSRGNPGTSGSGSVIVERDTRDHPWKIVWWDAHLLPGQQTNNYAEHTGLARGLEEAARRYSLDNQIIEAIGDSLLITNQMTGTVRINQANFTTIIDRTRAVLRHLYYVRFKHTLRTGNKMADKLANIAMDQAATPTTSTPLHAFLHTDPPLHQLHIPDPAARQSTTPSTTTPSHRQQTHGRSISDSNYKTSTQLCITDPRHG